MLYLGRRRNAYLVGLELSESEALLDELWSFVARPETRCTGATRSIRAAGGSCIGRKSKASSGLPDAQAVTTSAHHREDRGHEAGRDLLALGITALSLRPQLPHPARAGQISGPTGPARHSIPAGRRVRRRGTPMGGEDEVGAWHRGRGESWAQPRSPDG